jgi:His Kinase A (phospho-acceptor) domain/Histidine kinase-, DNA gyrase B-, and HSP90-like ATPase
MKDEFVALVSHELRTPLTSIRGYLELVPDDRDQLSGEHREFLQIVDRNADRLIHLVSDLLLLAQADAGRLSFDWTEVDLAPLVSHCVQAAQPAAEQGSVELVFDQSFLEPIVGDPARITQLLDNLISNAIKFTPAGGHVEVLVEASEGRVAIEIRDTPASGSRRTSRGSCSSGSSARAPRRRRRSPGPASACRLRRRSSTPMVDRSASRAPRTTGRRSGSSSRLSGLEPLPRASGSSARSRVVRTPHRCRDRA